jgi:hypothetical protein
VEKLLGAGGQGEVYDVSCNSKHFALKWYFKGSAMCTVLMMRIWTAFLRF